MRIIILDDNKTELEEFQQFLEEYYPQCEVCTTNNLVEFHECLFESEEGVAPYDKIFIDAQLKKPNGFSDDYYNRFLKEVEIDEGHLYREMIEDGQIQSSDLLGWWYFAKYLKKRIPNRIQDIAIKTGFARTVQKYLSNEKSTEATVFNKGDFDYEKKLKDFLNR